MPGAKSEAARPVWPGTRPVVCTSSANHAERFQPLVSGDGRSLVRPGIARVDDSVSTTGLGQSFTGAVSGRRQRTPGARRSHGGVVGPAGGRHRDGGPRFDQAVGPGAYLWWYVDAISDDGQHALSIIAFVGSVFSPYYASAFARSGEAVDAENHCAINVALYGAAGKRWAMTERGRGSLHRDSERLSIGPSQLKWTGQHLQIELDEVCVPIPRRVRGTVKLYPDALSDYSTSLDDAGKHRWGPIAPCARIEVDLQNPAISWRGSAYFDCNEGDEPVSRPFEAWDWSRARLADGSTAVIYDVRQTNGSQRLIAERFAPDGSSAAFEPASVRQDVGSTLWNIKRGIRGDEGGRTQVIETLEDTPFYARSLLKTQLFGQSVTAVHETLQPQRLASLPVRAMLPWRMPRRA
jgi:carotenoid 1,2-hydratase